MAYLFICNTWRIGQNTFKLLNLLVGKLWDIVNISNIQYSNIIVIFGLFSVMGKAEGIGENWHGHVTALTVSPDYRRLGLAATLMNFLEEVSEK